MNARYRNTTLTARHRRRIALAVHAGAATSGPAYVPLDSVALRAFVGRYDRGSGYIDDVHLVGGQLIATSTAETAAHDVGAHLLPVSTSAFSPEGVAPLIVFERDPTGRVVGYVQQQPDGTVARARRIDEDGVH